MRDWLGWVGGGNVRVVSNAFYYESYSLAAVISICPPEIAFSLISLRGEGRHDTLDCLDCFLARQIAIGDDFSIDYIVVGINGKLHNLESHLKHQSHPNSFALP